MIKKIGEVWVVSCDLCDWNTETDDEKGAIDAYTNHIKIAHGKPMMNIKEDQDTSPSQRQPHLPDPIALQGKKKKKQ